MELELRSGDAGNPFVSLWLQPARTVRALVDRDPKHLVAPLAMLGGIAAQFPAIATGDPSQAALAGFRGAWAGLCFVWIAAAALRWSGARLGGRGTFEELRTALAWSAVPSVALVPFCLPGVALLGARLHEGDLASSETSTAGLIAFASWQIARVVFTVWRLCVAVAMVAEVQRFSRVRAFASCLLAIAPLPAIGLLAYWIITWFKRAG